MEIETREPLQKWLIVEGRSSGHRLWYVRLLLDELARRGLLDRTCVLTTKSAFKSTEWQSHLTEYAEVLTVEIVEDVSMAKVHDRWSRETLLAVPDGDRWLLSLAFLLTARARGRQGRVLLLRPEPNRSLRSRIVHLGKRSLRAWVRMRAPGVELLALAANPSGRPHEVADPVEFRPSYTDRDAWLRKHGANPRLPLVLVIGDVSERKSVPELIDATGLQSAPECTLALVGCLSDHVVALVAARAPAADRPVLLVPGYLEDAVFDSWVLNSDVVCVLHKNEGSSGVLLKASAAGTPVMVGISESLTRVAAELGCPSVNVHDLASQKLVTSLRKALALPRGELRDAAKNEVSTFASALLGFSP